LRKASLQENAVKTYKKFICFFDIKILFSMSLQVRFDGFYHKKTDGFMPSSPHGKVMYSPLFLILLLLKDQVLSF